MFEKVKQMKQIIIKTRFPEGRQWNFWVQISETNIYIECVFVSKIEKLTTKQTQIQNQKLSCKIKTKHIAEKPIKTINISTSNNNQPRHKIQDIITVNFII